MTLKRKIAINIALAFSILFGLTSLFIYINFSSFRKEEFKERLEEKAFNTAKLLIEVQEIDQELLRVIDQNSINKLYNEKTLVFNGQYELIYSSIDNFKINYTKDDLINLNSQKSFFRNDNNGEILGIYFPFQQGDYYVLVSSEDTYGISKLAYLKYSLLITYLISIILVWILTYFFIKKLLQPLDDFQKKITSISENKLKEHLIEKDTNNEIDLLTRAFNQMLTRLENAFNKQKEFTSNASHELYTPLTRIAMQIENLIDIEDHSKETVHYLKNINTDVYHLSELINSLSLLANVNKENLHENFKKIRIDEVIFDANELIKKTFSHFNLIIDIHCNDSIEEDLIVFGNESLLKIVFVNLLKNANLYSTTKTANLNIIQNTNDSIFISIENDGKTISNNEQSTIFDPFMRGENAKKSKGSGLGLAIVKRILEYHNATIDYTSSKNNNNIFIIKFSI